MAQNINTGKWMVDHGIDQFILKNEKPEPDDSNSWGGEITAQEINTEILDLIADYPYNFERRVWSVNGGKIVLRKNEYQWMLLEYWPKGSPPTARLTVAEYVHKHRWCETGHTRKIENWLADQGVPCDEIPFNGEPWPYEADEPLTRKEKFELDDLRREQDADDYGLEAVA